MKRIFVIKVEHTNLMNRSDLLNWLCSENVRKGKSYERYWILDTSTQIFNTYNDPDVSYLMAMLWRTNEAGYQSIMIMKHGIDDSTSRTDSPQEETGSSKSEQTNPSGAGEIPTGEPGPEVHPDAPSTEDSAGGMGQHDGNDVHQG